MVRRLIPIKPFHERTRRTLARAALLVGGIAPLVLVGVMTVLFWSPAYQGYLKRSWETRVGSNLGVRVRAGSLQWLAPEQFRAEDVVAFHPETDAPLVKIPKLDGLMTSQGWSVILKDPVLDGEQFESSLQLMHDGFLCKPQTREMMLAVSVPNGLSIHRGGEQVRLGQIELWMRPTADKSSIQTKFAFADQPFGEVELQVVRSHSSDDLSTSFEIVSPKSWIGIENFHAWLPPMRSLGANARFRGVLRARWGVEESDAMFQGDIDRINLGDLTGPLGSVLRGDAMASIERLNFSDGRILFAKGKLQVAQGLASTAWLRRASQWLQLPSSWESQMRESQNIESFALGIELSPEGVRLEGLLPGPSQWPPVAVKLEQGTLCTPKEVVPMSHLVAAFQSPPAGETSVDLNAMRLAAILPWPSPSKEGVETKGEGANRVNSSRITRRWEESKVR